MPPIILLVVAGTIAQKFVGLYVAERTIFYTPIIWAWDVIPLPGGLTLLGLLTLGLAIKFIFKSRWSWNQSGIILAHAGALLLLAGGLYTGMTREDGYITIAEGETGQVVRDYYQRNLLVVQDQNILTEVPRGLITPDHKLRLGGTDLALDILSACHNCKIENRVDDGEADLRGTAQLLTLTDIPAVKEEEANVSGFTFRLSGADAETNGTYLLFEGGPHVKFTANGKAYEMVYDKAMRQIPFALQLTKFEKITYPGTDTAKAYTSDVMVKDGTSSWPVRIEMNQPLRYRGYTFYQSSFLQGKVGEKATILAVSRNKGWLIPYAATILTAIGLLLHVFIRLKKVRTTACVLGLLFAFGFGAAPAHADSLSMQDFGRLPILSEGRIQPLDSFARTQLTSFAGRDSLPDRSALQFLGDVIFTPSKAADIACFQIDNKLVREALKLPERQGRLYTLAELAPGLAATADTVAALMTPDHAKLTPDEQALADVHTHVLMFNQLIQALSLTLPLPIAPAPEVAALFPRQPEGGFTFLDLQKVEPQLLEQVRAFLTPEKTEDPDKLTPAEQRLSVLVFTLQKLREGGSRNMMFKIIPPLWAQDGTDWQAPWPLLLSGKSAPLSAQILAQWHAMALAWQSNNADNWHKASRAAYDTARAFQGVSGLRLTLEVMYSTLSPFTLALVLYGAVFVLSLLALVRDVMPLSRHLWRTWMGWAMLVAPLALIAHLAGIAMRIIIMNRPPVGTLYESVLFVAWISAAVALWMGIKKRTPAFLLGGAVIGFLLLAIAPALQTSKDGMTTLPAVLNTNFWLATHVVCITIGYGVCLITSFLAHALLATEKSEKDKPEWRRTLLVLAIVSLFFTAVGTLLGGVWADQSWGRFWGWDPKENGALIITLWIIWLLHGRLGGQLSPRAFTAGLASLSIVVALAWFGVNLLSVGLHSYGFISGIAAGLGLFCALELGLIALLWIWAKRRAALTSPSEGSAHVA